LTAFSVDTRAAGWGLATQIIGSEQRAVAGGTYRTLINQKLQTYNYTWYVARYHQDGSIDTSFGPNGNGITTNSNNGFLNTIAIQPADNKIVIGGSANNKNGISIFTVARYTVAGLLDTSFGNGGMVQVQVSISKNKNSYCSSAALAIVLQPDGKVVGAGTCSNVPFVIRLNSDGALDNTFANNGQFVYSGADWSAGGMGVALESVAGELRIVVAGAASNTSGSESNTVLRLTANGSLDKSFRGSGVIQTPFLTDGINSDVAVDSNARIVVAGAAWPHQGGPLSLLVARYNIDGTLDTTFNQTGYFITPGLLGHCSALALIIQSDGRILMAGNDEDATTSPVKNYFAVWRFNSDGTPDVSFGIGGEVTTGFTSDQMQAANSIALQSDGKFVVGGVALVNSVGELALARYWQ
jgi:uncharacterized delta-60 repeat protein